MRVGKIRADTGLGTAGNCLVDILKVEGKQKRLTDPPIVQRSAAGVDGKPGHARGTLVWDLTLDHPAICNRGEAIGTCPFVGVKFPIAAQLSGFESFEQNGLIAEEINSQLVKVLRSNPKG